MNFKKFATAAISCVFSLATCFTSFAAWNADPGTFCTSTNSWKEGNVTVVQVDGYHGQACDGTWQNYMSFALIAYDASVAREVKAC